jgi:hypothetical protein
MWVCFPQSNLRSNVIQISDFIHAVTKAEAGPPVAEVDGSSNAFVHAMDRTPATASKGFTKTTHFKPTQEEL